MANTPTPARSAMSVIRPAKPNAGTGATAAHVPMLTLFVSSVTAPLRASALPVTFAPVVSVMLVPSVAELPTCQFTFGGHVAPALLIRTTDEALAVVNVLPILKRNAAFGLP